MHKHDIKETRLVILILNKGKSKFENSKQDKE